MGKIQLEEGKELRDYKAWLDEFVALWEPGIKGKDVV